MAKRARKKAAAPKQRAFRGLKKEPDRWPDAPPASTDLEPVDLAYFMRAGLKSGMLTSFEENIADQVLWLATKNRRLNAWHTKALDELGVLRRCWDSDLDLWDDSYRRSEGSESALECRGG